ncbi:MAG: hypothetical protein RR540_01340 [Oscillospiraceae bacterium]
MNFFTKMKKRFLNTMNNDLTIRIYSVILAVIAWFVIAATINQIITVPVKNVAVTASVAGSVAEQNGLSVTNQKDIQKITVTIEGNRTVIGDMRADDIDATLIMDGVTKPGEYDLPIKVVGKTNKAFTVKSTNPPTIAVKVDKIISKTFPLEAEAPNIKIADGYINDTPVCTPAEITVKGPEEQINKITKCVVRTEDDNGGVPISKSFETIKDNKLIFYNGNIAIADDNLTYDKIDYAIQVNVLMKKVLPITIAIDNVPDDFPIDQLKYTLDVSEIEVSAPNDMLKDDRELTVGSIKLNDINIGTEISFPITLPEGYRNLSGVTNVNVTFASEGLATKKINIKNSDILVTYAPLNYKITPVTTGYSVTFVGPADIVKNLTVNDVVAKVDVSGITDIQSGTYFNAPLSLSVPSKGAIWALGSYTVALLPSEK